MRERNRGVLGGMVTGEDCIRIRRCVRMRLERVLARCEMGRLEEVCSAARDARCAGVLEGAAVHVSCIMYHSLTEGSGHRRFPAGDVRVWTNPLQCGERRWAFPWPSTSRPTPKRPEHDGTSIGQLGMAGVKAADRHGMDTSRIPVGTGARHKENGGWQVRERGGRYRSGFH